MEELIEKFNLTKDKDLIIMKRTDLLANFRRNLNVTRSEGSDFDEEEDLSSSCPDDDSTTDFEATTSKRRVKKSKTARMNLQDVEKLVAESTVRTAEGEKAWICKICKHFSSMFKAGMRKHLEQQHPTNGDRSQLNQAEKAWRLEGVKKSEVATADERRRWKCFICSQQIYSNSSIRYHLAQRHLPFLRKGKAAYDFHVHKCQQLFKA